MPKSFATILIFTIFLVANTTVSAFPDSPIDTALAYNPPNKALLFLKKTSVKQIEVLAGRRLTLKEKVGVFLLKKTNTKNLRNLPGEPSVKTKKGKAAFVLGICALGGLVLHIVGLLSIPCAILAIIFGAQAVKENKNDRQGKTGLILGIVFFGVLLLLILLVIALLSAFTI